MASESVVAVMQLLARFRFVPSDVIREECFSGYKTESQVRIANRTLKQLRDRGLVDSEIVFGRTWVHWLTEEGARANDVEGGRGVGPKLALGVLAVFTPDLLRDAVAREDTTALQRVSGIGKKGAQRLILELGTKLGPATGGRPGAKTPGGGTAESDVIDALIGLGWAEREAHEAFAEAHAAFPEGDVATLLRASLQTIGQRR